MKFTKPLLSLLIATSASVWASPEASAKPADVKAAVDKYNAAVADYEKKGPEAFLQRMGFNLTVDEHKTVMNWFKGLPEAPVAKAEGNKITFWMKSNKDVTLTVKVVDLEKGLIECQDKDWAYNTGTDRLNNFYSLHSFLWQFIPDNAKEQKTSWLQRHNPMDWLIPEAHAGGIKLDNPLLLGGIGAAGGAAIGGLITGNPMTALWGGLAGFAGGALGGLLFKHFEGKDDSKKSAPATSSGH